MVRRHYRNQLPKNVVVRIPASIWAPIVRGLRFLFSFFTPPGHVWRDAVAVIVSVVDGIWLSQTTILCVCVQIGDRSTGFETQRYNARRVGNDVVEWARICYYYHYHDFYYYIISTIFFLFFGKRHNCWQIFSPRTDISMTKTTVVTILIRQINRWHSSVCCADLVLFWTRDLTRLISYS